MPSTNALSQPRAALAATAPRLLLIDDEAIILRSVGRLLERQGYAVETALTGEAALAALGERRFAAIVCDLQMPGLSGEELFAKITLTHPECVTRVVFATGDARLAGEFLRRSGCPYLEKPYELTDLLDILNIIGAAASSEPAA